MLKQSFMVTRMIPSYPQHSVPLHNISMDRSMVPSNSTLGELTVPTWINLWKRWSAPQHADHRQVTLASSAVSGRNAGSVRKRSEHSVIADSLSCASRRHGGYIVEPLCRLWGRNEHDQRHGMVNKNYHADEFFKVLGENLNSTNQILMHSHSTRYWRGHQVKEHKVQLRFKGPPR